MKPSNIIIEWLKEQGTNHFITNKTHNSIIIFIKTNSGFIVADNNIVVDDSTGTIHYSGYLPQKLSEIPILTILSDPSCFNKLQKWIENVKCKSTYPIN